MVFLAVHAQSEEENTEQLSDLIPLGLFKFLSSGEHLQEFTELDLEEMKRLEELFAQDAAFIGAYSTWQTGYLAWAEAQQEREIEQARKALLAQEHVPWQEVKLRVLGIDGELDEVVLEELKEVYERRLASLAGSRILLRLQATEGAELSVFVKGLEPGVLTNIEQLLFKQGLVELYRIDEKLTTLLHQGEDLAQAELGERKPSVLTPLGSNPELGFTQEEQAARAGGRYVLEVEPAFSVGKVEQASASRNPAGWVVNVTLSEAGGKAMQALTKELIAQPLAIVLDGRLISAPIVNGVFGQNFQITGNFELAEAQALAMAFEQPLSVEVEVIGQEKEK